MQDKDWTGNSRSAHAVIGAHNYTQYDRETNDYYATEPKAAHLLMAVEKFSPSIWECACGEGHLAKEFVRGGYNVYASDIVSRGYGDVLDFLKTKPSSPIHIDIVTNPPYSKAQEFIEHAIDIIGEGYKVAMFLKIQFLEGKRRRALFDKYPPKTVYVGSSRLCCAMNGDFEKMKGANAICYAWYIWEKGYNGETVIKWIN